MHMDIDAPAKAGEGDTKRNYPRPSGSKSHVCPVLIIIALFCPVLAKDHQTIKHHHETIMLFQPTRKVTRGELKKGDIPK